MSSRGVGSLQILLLGNLVVMTALLFRPLAEQTAIVDPKTDGYADGMPPVSTNASGYAMAGRGPNSGPVSLPKDDAPTRIAAATAPTTTEPAAPIAKGGASGIGGVAPDGFYYVRPKEGERDFYEIGKRTKTDKIEARRHYGGCLENRGPCVRPNCKRTECRPWGHYYDTIYQQRLGPWSRDDIPEFQFLEIGFHYGAGYDLFREFLPRGEGHSIEIQCEDSASRNPRYRQYLDERRLHCGDASRLDFLTKVWEGDMNRTDSPPLQVVIDDGSHLSKHMAATVFFWFPKIAPRGVLIVEDIQPIASANAFRTQFLPQIMKDLHYCDDPGQARDDVCFPTLLPLLASVHCEMHICVFERNDRPAMGLSAEESGTPPNALDMRKCGSMLPGKW